ncbi:MAG TPA: acyl-CoA dehydrogenase [Deltaproteobacteria bacterium]|nr:acyl-CoA dehydrogenase [Deltaproteobacteria bacterium]
MTDRLPLRDLQFLLEDVLQMKEVLQEGPYADHDVEGLRSMLEMAREMALEHFAPIADAMDAEEPRLVDGKVKLHPAAGPALQAFVDAGFVAAPHPAEHGGLDLPFAVHQCIQALFAAVNSPLLTYAGLTIAAAGLLDVHGSEELKAEWLARLIEGRFFGTMALSEPHAGSSLADLRTKATPQPDGTYRLKGDKMWITGADQDFSENIVHFVLARLPGAPAGTRGISLFLVPKLLADDSGEYTVENDVRVAGINHKMGFRGSVNTVFSIGENQGAVGYLVGDENRGLHAMFHMMNEARIGVGLCAAALAWGGYRHALAYARERQQGRPVSLRDATRPQVPIIQHADVRRMLLEQKAIAEGALHLVLFSAMLVDRQRVALAAGDQAKAASVGLLLDTLTPIAKAWSSDHGLRASSGAIQVLGGSGYTRDFPVERLYRDNRLNPIHEGTNGIQAMDLLGRKILAKGGGMALMQALQDAIDRGSQEGQQSRVHAEQLSKAVETVASLTMGLAGVAQSDGPEVLLANATPYLHLVGHTVVAWMWLEQTMVAERQLAAGTGDADFLRGKLASARYFYAWELPKTAVWASVLNPVERTPLDVHADWL